MIVKNESAVIERCLASVRNHIDAWVIVDTGSTDDTREKIRAALHGIPGALHQREWQNFGHNRTEAVTLAYQSGCDYFLFIDADDTLLAPPDFHWPELTHDTYELWLSYGSYRYTRQMLVSAKLSWRWVGVLHEYPDASPAATSVGRLAQPQIRASTEGARSSDPLKYERDAELLRQGLVAEPGNARYLFYLAQSYRDAGKLDDALATYALRVAAGGWEEEVWRARFEQVRLKERLGHPDIEVNQGYVDVFERRPQRAEPLVDLARRYRISNQFSLAYLYASQAAALPLPDDRLFVEQDCYLWRALDELAIAAYRTDRFAQCASICEALLASGHVPEEHVARIVANRNFAQQKMTKTGSTPTPASTLTSPTTPAVATDRPPAQSGTDGGAQRLNVGCGRNIREGWINLESYSLRGVQIVADLEHCAEKPLPLMDDSIDEFLLSHVLEHIRNVLPMMQELHRVARPSAVMKIHVPFGSSDDAFEDPTHVRQLFTGSFGYFSQPYYWRADYGYRGDWVTEDIELVVSAAYAHLPIEQVMNHVNYGRNVVAEMIATLRAVKPIREPLRELQVAPQVRVRFA